MTEEDKNRSKAHDQMEWSEWLDLKRAEVQKFALGDRVRFPLGGLTGLWLYGTVDGIHELWIGVCGDDGGGYVCPGFCGIEKINMSRL